MDVFDKELTIESQSYPSIRLHNKVIQSSFFLNKLNDRLLNVKIVIYVNNYHHFEDATAATLFSQTYLSHLSYFDTFKANKLRKTARQRNLKLRIASSSRVRRVTCLFKQVLCGLKYHKNEILAIDIIISIHAAR